MIHLHTHSMYSLRDSIIKHEDLIARLQEIGQVAVAITDHGTSLGGISFYKALKKKGIKYIHGCELYICDNATIKDKDNRYYHLIALCENDTGRKNLNRLMSKSERPENFYYKPRIDFSMLSQHGEGLIILSACLAGEIARYLQDDKYEYAKEVAQKYKSLFGDRYYLEVQSHGDPIQIETNKKILQLADELDIECVVTCDAHYVYESDRRYQNKYAFNGSYKEDGESYVDCFVQSEEEVRARLEYFSQDDVDRLIKNTHVIANRCNVEMPLSAPIMPKIDTPPEYGGNKEWICDICKNGFEKKLNIRYDVNTQTGTHVLMLPEHVEKYVDRFKYEINSLERMGFIDYILLVYTYSNQGTRRGIARGSGGGSLVCYLSNITNIDPIEHGLYFERFIDVGALARLEAGEITAKELKIPDIDLDFSADSCKEVLHFLYNKYGEERVASIGKFTTNQTKGSIRDMCRVLDIDLKRADEIAKSFEYYEIDEVDNMISGAIPRTQSAEDSIRYVLTYPELFDYVRKLNGLPKSFGLHACGKVISTKELDEFLPSCYDDDGIRYLQGDMHDVEDVGLVKIDVLGLRTLDQEYDTLEQSNETEEFINPKQDYSDEKVLDIFRNGDTVGIFQMSSPGMKKTLKKMKVKGIECLSIANALYRPGAMNYIDTYCNRRSGIEKVEYLHPDLEPILQNTYGVIVFQEQLIEIGRMAKIHNPDLLRKATGKKDPELLKQVKPELEEKLLERGWSQPQFDKLWADMLEFSKYSFNKCVSAETKILRAGQRKGVFNPSVEEMYRIMNDKEYAIHTGHKELHAKYKKYGYGNALSMCQDGRIRKNKIVNIFDSGVRVIHRITTLGGSKIDCTENHKFPTPEGEKTLSELRIGSNVFVIGEYEKTNKKYNFTNGDFQSNVPVKGQKGFQCIPNGSSALFEAVRNNHVSNRDCCEVCGCEYSESKRFEQHHKDGDRKNNTTDNFLWCCVSCHKKEEYKLKRTKAYEKGIPSEIDVVASIDQIGVEHVYDIEMAAPSHNFISESGLVTSNSHSSAYGIIAYMTAKQKAYYPAEFYAGLCNSYLGKSAFVKDNADEIVSDMMRHNIRIAPFNFRNDHRRCHVENKQVVYAVPLIRDCNETAANALYHARDKEYQKFWNLLDDLYGDSVSKAQMNILILLGFFNEFGSVKNLLRMNDIYIYFKDRPSGEMKTISKERLPEAGIMRQAILAYSSDRNDKGKELKTLRITNLDAILDMCEEDVMSIETSDFDFKNKVVTQRQYLGFVMLTTGKDIDRKKLYVKTLLPAYRRRDGEQFGYYAVAQSIGSGKTTMYTVMNRKFSKCPFEVDDVIFCEKYSEDVKDGKRYYTLEDYFLCV